MNVFVPLSKEKIYSGEKQTSLGGSEQTSTYSNELFERLLRDEQELLFWLQDKHPDVFKERFGDVTIAKLSFSQPSLPKEQTCIGEGVGVVQSGCAGELKTEELSKEKFRLIGIPKQASRKGCGKRIDAMGYIHCGDEIRENSIPQGKYFLCEECTDKSDYKDSIKRVSEDSSKNA